MTETAGSLKRAYFRNQTQLAELAGEHGVDIKRLIRDPTILDGSARLHAYDLLARRLGLLKEMQELVHARLEVLASKPIVDFETYKRIKTHLTKF